MLMLRAYRMAGPTGTAVVGPKPGDISELLYQIQNFHSFLWASGGAFSDFLIHNIDECCWMKNAWPVKAQASGGRHYRGDYGRSELRQLLGRIHLRRRHEDARRRPHDARLPQRVRQLRPRQQGLGDHLDRRPRPRPQPHLQGPEVRERRPRLAVRRQRAEPLPARMGRPHRRDPQRTSRTTKSSAASKRASSRRWAAWPPTPGKSSPTTTC